MGFVMLVVVIFMAILFMRTKGPFLSLVNAFLRSISGCSGYAGPGFSLAKRTRYGPPQPVGSGNTDIVYRKPHENVVEEKPQVVLMDSTRSDLWWWS